MMVALCAKSNPDLPPSKRNVGADLEAQRNHGNNYLQVGRAHLYLFQHHHPSFCVAAHTVCDEEEEHVLSTQLQAVRITISMGLYLYSLVIVDRYDC